MFELITAGGWLMLPIVICSVIALTIVIERIWTLQRSRVLPPPLLMALRKASQGSFKLEESEGKRVLQSPLGRIIAVALRNRNKGRDIVKESVEDTGRHVIHELERYLNTLGTIAAITPLLGLLGTVFGMIEVFSVISARGSGDTELLAGGISQALLTTAGGLTVAIPSLLFYRFFRGKIDALAISIEEEALRLISLMPVQSAPSDPAVSKAA